MFIGVISLTTCIKKLIKLSLRYYGLYILISLFNRKRTKAGVAHGSVLVPVLYLLYASYIPELERDTIVICSDDTAILAVCYIGGRLESRRSGR